MAARWLPNNEEFFSGLVRLLDTSENNLNSASYDNFEETHSEAQNLICDLHTLLRLTLSSGAITKEVIYKDSREKEKDVEAGVGVLGRLFRFSTTALTIS